MIRSDHFNFQGDQWSGHLKAGRSFPQFSLVDNPIKKKCLEAEAATL